MKCGHLCVSEPVYLYVDPPKMKRQIIGEVTYCWRCCKSKGDVRKAATCPSNFNETSWQVMLQDHPAAPYFFIARAGRIVPCDFPDFNSESPAPIQAPGISQETDIA